MFSLARSSSLRLSATLASRVCSRSPTVLRLVNAVSARRAVPLCANLRQFSDVAAASRSETQGTTRTRTRTHNPPSGTCYIANVPYQVTAEQLKEAFSDFGKITSVRLMTSNSGLPRGVGFVEFESIREAVSFVEGNEADPIFVLDRRLFIDHAQTSRNTIKSPDPSDTLMVQDIQGGSADDIREMFGSFAESVVAVRFHVKKDVEFASRHAFVQFRTVEIATEAMDAFRNQSGNPVIKYAIQRQPPANEYTLTSRLSQHRD